MDNDSNNKEKKGSSILVILFGLLMAYSVAGHFLIFLDLLLKYGWTYAAKERPVGVIAFSILAIVAYIFSMRAFARNGHEKTAKVMLAALALLIILALVPLFDDRSSSYEYREPGIGFR